MTAPALIQCQTADAVATLTIARPHKLNALTNEIMSELAATLDRIAADDSVRVVVLTGEGRAFSAGFENDFLVDGLRRTGNAGRRCSVGGGGRSKTTPGGT